MTKKVVQRVVKTDLMKKCFICNAPFNPNYLKRTIAPIICPTCFKAREEEGN